MARGKEFRIFLFLFVVCLIIGTFPVSEAADAIGFVINSSGEWFASPTQKQLLIGETVFAKSTLTCNPKTDQRVFISISLLNGELISKECKDSPVTMPDTFKRQTGSIERIVLAVGSIFKKDSKRYVSAISRGSGQEDYILKLDHGTADLTPVMRGRKSGDYDFYFASMDRNYEFEVAVKWQPSDPLLVSSKEFIDGLFRVSIFEQDDDAYGSVNWILLSAPEKFEQRVAVFNEAKNVVNGWPKTEPTARKYFLRAVLQSLVQENMEEGEGY